MSFKGTFGVVVTVLFFHIFSSLYAQPTRWQQEVHYEMEIDMDEPNHQFDGKQELIYINHSPDTLSQVFYHLYFNAFQPNSMMDTRSRTILDPDGRVGDRIYHLDEDEIGYHKVSSLTMNGKRTEFEISETLLKVELPEAILPGDTVRFNMEFDSQVPLQIRRSGRDNREGIDFSMTQWYPKMANYDYRGWHTSPYVGREYYAPFGTFDVKITMDAEYTIGATGTLQNPDEIGHGYSNANPAADRLTWHFYAENVHNFAWAADPDFVHYKTQTNSGVDIHIIYQEDGNPSVQNWEMLGEYTARSVEFMSDNYGEYPYPQFTVIQGGDGGMEYPMITLITGHRSLGSLVGVTAHELAHMWYYGVLGTNESIYPWIDEGFTVYTSSELMKYLFDRPGDPQLRSYYSYLYLKNLGLEEPLSTHADRYKTNSAYGTASYSMGAIFLNQLGYIVGEENLKNGLKRFFNTWKFKHPNDYDFIREIEKESKIELDWYIEDWIQSTKDIDYAIGNIEENDDYATVILERKGEHLMPVDLFVTYDDGSTAIHTIPMHLMRSPKVNEFSSNIDFNIANEWRWVDKTYSLDIPTAGKSIKKLEIDPTLRMADINRLNNTWPFPVNKTYFEAPQANWQEYGLGWRPAVWYGDRAGVRLGFDSYGEYLFGQNRLDASFWLTSGTLDDYGVEKTDVDYELTYTHKLDQFGLEAYVIPSVKRYYGIIEESITFEKLIGEYGRRTPVQRKLSVGLFHQVRTSERNIDALSAGWQGGDVKGLRMSYEVGNAGSNGVSLFIQAASHRQALSASYVTLSGNKTYDWAGDKISTRFGFSVGSGSKNLPLQYSFTLSGASPESAWNNQAYWSVANIHPDLINELNLSTHGGNGLIGYAIADGTPDTQYDSNGNLINNYFNFTIWNTFQPFTGTITRPLALELFAGTGQTWSGVFVDDFPIFSGNNRDFMMASMGAGVTYDISSMRALSKYAAQSELVNNLKLSFRMPFYMNGLRGEDDFGTWFLFGISDNF